MRIRRVTGREGGRWRQECTGYDACRSDLIVHSNESCAYFILVTQPRLRME